MGSPREKATYCPDGDTAAATVFHPAGTGTRRTPAPCTQTSAPEPSTAAIVSPLALAATLEIAAGSLATTLRRKSVPRLQRSTSPPEVPATAVCPSAEVATAETLPVAGSSAPMRIRGNRAEQRGPGLRVLVHVVSLGCEQFGQVQVRAGQRLRDRGQLPRFGNSRLVRRAVGLSDGQKRGDDSGYEQDRQG